MLHAVAQAIAGGARMVQYRDKSADDVRRRRDACALAALCRRHGVAFIVNDDVGLALRCGADGVHVGRGDSAVAEARRRLGARAIVGASCYNDLALAHDATDAGATYVAFGSFYPSTVKPEAVRADAALLRRARAELDLPIVAIGGITADNGAALIAAGADVVDVALIAFRIQVWPLSALEEQRFAAYPAEGAHWRVDAAGNVDLGLLEELVAVGHGACRAPVVCWKASLPVRGEA